MSPADDTQVSAESSSQQDKVQLGIKVAVALAVLTVIEYVIAVSLDDPLIWLLPFVIAKAALIMEYFMHFSAVLKGGSH